jgi:hypothetical protein
MHIISILLFPVRLVTAPIVVPILTGMICAISQLGGPHQVHFWPSLLPMTGAWLLW